MVCAIAIALLALPGLVAAQMHGGGARWVQVNTWGQHNMDMMNQMTGEMQQMMRSHQMTPEQ